jgi:hypothetical protein
MTDRFYAFSRTRNRGFRKAQAEGARPLQIVKEKTTCEVDPTPVAASVLAAAVSPAISLAVSPASDREQLVTEIQGSKPSNQPGSQSVSQAPNCYQCMHRQSLAGSAHSSCNALGNEGILIAPIFMAGKSEVMAGGLHIKAATHGVRSGWFFWPLNFDPTWLQICSLFKTKD